MDVSTIYAVMAHGDGMDDVPLNDLRCIHAHAIVEMLQAPEARHVRARALRAIAEAPGRDAPPMAWKVAVVEGLAPLSSMDLVGLGLATRLAGIGLGMVDWGHVAELMANWEKER